MVMTRWANTTRRAWGRLRPGGKRLVRLGLLGGRLHHRITPDQTHERQVAVQARPTAALVIAQAQLLFAIFMEAFDAPAAMRQPQLLPEPPPVQPPGEVPF